MEGGTRIKKIPRENLENTLNTDGIRTMSSYDKMDINALDNRVIGHSMFARRQDDYIDQERNEYDDNGGDGRFGGVGSEEIHSKSMFLKGGKGFNGNYDDRLSRSLD